MKNVFFLFTLLFIFACSTVQKKPASSEIYSPEFLTKIEKSKDFYKKNELGNALKQLETISNDSISNAEKAMKYNLIGVIHFSENKFQASEQNFLESLKTAGEDPSLLSQVNLNITSTYFKLTKYDYAYSFLKKIDKELLNQVETKKYFQLTLALASQLKKNPEIADALVNLNQDKKNFDEFKNNSQVARLLEIYKSYSEAERIRFLESYEDKNMIAVAYIGYLDALEHIAKNEKDKGKDLLEWLDEHYANHPEISKALKDLDNQKINLSDIQTESVGIILPLSGDKENFGKKALQGIELGLGEYFKDSKMSLVTKDSQANGQVGALKVKELIENDQVGFIIGGLFPDEAAEEYFEAKKRGVIFISLSTLNIGKELKDQYLIELPGSIESQVQALTKDSILNNFGKKVGIFYPETAQGESYLKEFFRLANTKGLKITQVMSYKKDTVDFREPVEKMLSLKHTKERQEEINYLQNIYAFEKNTSIKRLQVLNPIVDFDWMFLPAFPGEALQIIPIFNYYDASNVKYFGGPSWRSEQMKKNQTKIGSVNFVGDDISKLSDSFGKKFFEKYNSYPKLIETISYDSMSVLNYFINTKKITDRDHLEDLIEAKDKIKGFTGEWSLLDGIWIKDLIPQKIRNQEFELIQ